MPQVILAMRTNRLERVSMNEKKILLGDQLGEFVFQHSWIGSCPVSWADRELSIRIRLIASQGDAPTAAQKKALRAFEQSKTDTLQKCKALLKPYCERVYGAECSGKAVEEYLTPVAGIFEKNGEYGFLFKCRFEDEINLAVKFSGIKAEVGTDDILL